MTSLRLFKGYLVDSINRDNHWLKREKFRRVKGIQSAETFEDALASYLGEEYIGDNVERDILIDFIETLFRQDKKNSI